MITENTTHTAESLARLLDRFRFPLLKAWIASHTNRIQEQESGLFPLLGAFDLDSADHARLLILAKLVGQSPIDDTESLRSAIRVRILVNRSSGKVPEMTKIARLLLGDSVDFSEYDPPSITFAPLVPYAGDAALAAALLREAKAGGVRLQVLFSRTTAAADRFRWGSSVTPALGGLFGSSVTADSGSAWSSVR